MSRSGLRLLGAAALLAGCTAGPLPETNRLSFGGVQDLAMPVQDMVGRRFQTVIRQQYDFSCGSAAIATLLRHHYADPVDERAAFLGMWRDGDQAQIRRLGFSLLDMKRWLAARGIAADGYKVSLQQIERTGLPGIALIDTDGYKHFVVVKGVENGQVLVGDPALGMRLMPASEFAAIWNGIYFAINGRVEGRRAAFGRESDWALAPRGRFTATMLPVSEVALALTRPLAVPREL